MEAYKRRQNRFSRPIAIMVRYGDHWTKGRHFFEKDTRSVACLVKATLKWALRVVMVWKSFDDWLDH